MKGFSFRLDRILKLREDAEHKQARVMGEASRAEADLDDRCRDQAQHLKTVGEQATPAPGLRTSAGMLQILQLTSDAAVRQLDQSEKARAEASKVTDLERERLQAARRDRKTLERLKEQKHLQWREDEVRDERKTMDEIASRPRGETQ